MKVLHFFKTYYPDTFGGVEQVIYQLAESGISYGIEASVLALSKQPSRTPFQVGHHTVYHAKETINIASTGFSLDVIAKFKALVEQADIVHYHFPWPFMDVVHFLAQVRKPTVVTYHSDVIRQKHLMHVYRPVQNSFLGSVDRIVATSPNYLTSSLVLQQYKDKVSIIPIGLDKASYPPVKKDRLDYWQHRFGKKFFLFVGVIRYYKGLHILLEAAKGLNYPIVIVGAGPIESELKAKASELGLTHIHFVGALPEEDKIALLESCYAVVFPSHLRSEAFGISLLEGAMYGKPMISSEIGTGTTYINIANETGLVVPPSEPMALRASLVLLWEDEQLARMLGGAAEKRFREFFTAESMVQNYYKLYSDLLAKPKRD